MIDKLAISLLSPLGSALFVFLLSVLLFRWRQIRLAIILSTLAALWLLIGSLPVISHSLRSSLEDSYPQLHFRDVPSAQVIVVLGGGVRPADQVDQLPDLNSAADRIWVGARLFKLGKAPQVLLTGGSDRSVSVTSEAVAMKELILDMGVPESSIILEENSRNTRENAFNSARLLKEMGLTRVLLVTSALHMHRAMALFEATGLDVMPVPADHEARHRFSGVDWLPSADALDGTSRAIKELVARAVGR